MFNKLKDISTIAFYTIGGAVLAMLIWMMGVIIIIPAIMYGGYKILQIRRSVRQQQEQYHDEHEDIADKTTPDPPKHQPPSHYH